MRIGIKKAGAQGSWSIFNLSGYGNGAYLILLITLERIYFMHRLNRFSHFNFNECLQGAYFARDDVNRPGFSDFFFKSASEEREHAIKFLEYLSMRGDEFSDKRALSGLPLVSYNSIPDL